MHVFKMQIFHSQPQQKCHVWVFFVWTNRPQLILLDVHMTSTLSLSRCQSSDWFTARREKRPPSLLVEVTAGFLCRLFCGESQTSESWFCYFCQNHLCLHLLCVYKVQQSQVCFFDVFIPTEVRATNLVYIVSLFLKIGTHWSDLAHTVNLTDQCISGELLTDLHHLHMSCFWGRLLKPKH